MNKKIYIIVIIILIYNKISAQEYHQKLDSIAEANQLVGMSVVVVCNNQIADSYHYGFSDIEREIRVNDNTKYRIASISKTITATALMLLYNEGEFDLDDDVDSYLGFDLANPSFPNDPITYRMLLSHTSSLQDGTGYSNFLSDTYNIAPPPHIGLLLRPQGDYYTPNMWRNERPGSFFTYSNCNFGVIATLVENISGQRFDNFVRSRLLRPLGITGDFNVNQIPNVDDVAVLYRNGVPQADYYQGNAPEPFDSANYTIGSNGLVFAPQGGLRVSARELAQFLKMHANNGVFNDAVLMDSAVICAMHNSQWSYNGSNGDNYYNLFNKWGLGFHISTNTLGGDIVFDSVSMIGHPGEAYGLISDMYFEKGKQFGLIFITNGYYGTAGYSFGEYSAFYEPEEKVFATIKENYYYACDTVHNEDTTSVFSHRSKMDKVAIWYNWQNRSLTINSSGKFETISIVSLHGQTLMTKPACSVFSLKDSIEAGLYIVVASGLEAVKTKLIYIY